MLRSKYTQKKKFSQYLCFLIKSTILDISLSNCIHELIFRTFTCTCLLCDKYCLNKTVSTKFKIHDVHVCGKPAGLFFHMLFDKERQFFLLQLSGENSVLASLSRRPGYRQISEIPRLDFLKQVHVLLTCHVVLDVMNDQRLVCKHAFDRLAVKMTSLSQGDHGYRRHLK